jgi:hypothetical protein
MNQGPVAALLEVPPVQVDTVRHHAKHLWQSIPLAPNMPAVRTPHPICTALFVIQIACTVLNVVRTWISSTAQKVGI